MYSKEELNSIERYLNKNKWYHGTRLSSLNSIKSGIDVSINELSELDFGSGFYLTNKIKSASSFINSVIKYDSNSSLSNTIPGYTKGIVLEYELSDLLSIFKDDQYKTLVFPKYDDDFAEFVFENRTKPFKKIMMQTLYLVFKQIVYQ